jgi:hypothetical protein
MDVSNPSGRYVDGSVLDATGAVRSADGVTVSDAPEERHAQSVHTRDQRRAGERPNRAHRALEAARRRGAEARRDLLAARGGVLTADQVAQRLGMTKHEVERWRRTKKLLALTAEHGRYVDPAWQFGPQGVLPGFSAVLSDFGITNPWSQAAFFLGGNIYLDGESPLEALQRGQVEAVRRAARAYGEHGAP